MSVDCGFTVSDAPIYASSWNMRNNLWVWVSYSIQLNALTKENSIGRWSCADCDWVNAPLVPVPAVVLHVIERSFAREAEPGISAVIVVSVTGLLVVMAGIPLRRAGTLDGWKIFQDPPDGWCRQQRSLRSSDHRRHHQSPCPIKIWITMKSLIW